MQLSNLASWRGVACGSNLFTCSSQGLSGSDATDTPSHLDPHKKKAQVIEITQGFRGG